VLEQVWPGRSIVGAAQPGRILVADNVNLERGLGREHWQPTLVGDRYNRSFFLHGRRCECEKCSKRCDALSREYPLVKQCLLYTSRALSNYKRSHPPGLAHPSWKVQRCVHFGTIARFLPPGERQIHKLQRCDRDY